MAIKDRIKAKEIEILLNKEFPKKTLKPSLRFTNHFSLLVAIILSARCRDTQVNKITFKLKPTSAKKLNIMSLKKLREEIKSCGLHYNKARFLKRLSKKIIKKHDGKVPTNYDDLTSLPGVGNKTANVFLAHIGKPYGFPVDSHIHRCVRIWGLCSDDATIYRTQKCLEKLFPEKNKWLYLHWQIIRFSKKYKNCQI